MGVYYEYALCYNSRYINGNEFKKMAAAMDNIGAVNMDPFADGNPPTFIRINKNGDDDIVSPDQINPDDNIHVVYETRGYGENVNHERILSWAQIMSLYVSLADHGVIIITEGDCTTTYKIFSMDVVVTTEENAENAPPIDRIPLGNGVYLSAGVNVSYNDAVKLADEEGNPVPQASIFLTDATGNIIQMIASASGDDNGSVDLTVFGEDNQVIERYAFEDPDENPDVPDDDIVDAEFTSEWDNDMQLTSMCKVNLRTHEVFDIAPVAINVDAGTCTNEFVKIDGVDHLVYQKDAYDDLDADDFWYA